MRERLKGRLQCLSRRWWLQYGVYVQMLCERSQGIFLYARLVLDDLEEGMLSTNRAGLENLMPRPPTP